MIARKRILDLALLVAVAPLARPQCPLPASSHRAAEITGTSLSGQPVRLTAMRGKVVLLNFWATWCVPCLQEMPKFSAWQQTDSARGLAVLGVSMDDDAATARTVATRMHLAYPVMMGTAHIGTAYGGVMGLPVTVLIDRRGNIRKRYDGGASVPAIRRDLDCLLAEKP